MEFQGIGVELQNAIVLGRFAGKYSGCKFFCRGKKFLADKRLYSAIFVHSLVYFYGFVQHEVVKCRAEERAADEFGFQFCIDYGRDPYGMSNSLNKLLQLSESEAKSSKFMQMFSSHPETQKRADRVKEKADEYVKSKQ